MVWWNNLSYFAKAQYKFLGFIVFILGFAVLADNYDLYKSNQIKYGSNVLVSNASIYDGCAGVVTAEDEKRILTLVQVHCTKFEAPASIKIDKRDVECLP